MEFPDERRTLWPDVRKLNSTGVDKLESSVYILRLLNAHPWILVVFSQRNVAW